MGNCCDTRAACGVWPQRWRTLSGRTLRRCSAAGNNRKADAGPGLRIIAGFVVDVPAGRFYLSSMLESGDTNLVV